MRACKINLYARFNEKPMCGSLVGFSLIEGIAAGLARAGSLDAERLVAGFRGAEFGTPVGPVSFRALDHQGTLGVFVGTVALRDNRGVMADWRYVPGAELLPADDAVRRMRPPST